MYSGCSSKCIFTVGFILLKKCLSQAESKITMNFFVLDFRPMPTQDIQKTKKKLQNAHMHTSTIKNFPYWANLLYFRKSICCQRNKWQKHLILPCTAKTLQGWFPWRDDSFFEPLMKAGKLGLLWSPTSFPGCCPIRAGCQAAAGTLQAGLSCPPGKEEIGKRKESVPLARALPSQNLGDGGHQHKSVMLQYVSVYHALMECECFTGHFTAI